MITVNHEYYVSLEMAKLLKEAGFNWECDYHYLGDNCIYHGFCNNDPIFKVIIAAPTLDVAQRWFRETQKYQVAILPNGLKGYTPLCFLYKEPITQPFECYSTYEEAQEAGIKKALEIILEKGE